MQKLLKSSESSSESQAAAHDRLCIDFVSVSFEIMAELWLPFAHKVASLFSRCIFYSYFENNEESGRVD